MASMLRAACSKFVADNSKLFQSHAAAAATQAALLSRPAAQAAL